jgi:hypothetical protein
MFTRQTNLNKDITIMPTQHNDEQWARSLISKVRYGQPGGISEDRAVRELLTDLKKREAEARINELNLPRSYNLDVSKSDDYKQGFRDAILQVGKADEQRLAQLQQNQSEEQNQ